MKRFPGLKTLAILFLPLFIAACAVDRPPTGGPPDTTPLAVIASSPEPGTVNVSPRTIHLEFNRFVTTPALAKAIFFSPVIKEYQVSMHGKEAEIRIYSPLKPGRTYSLTLRKSLKSYYGTELASSWSLPFSTGPVIDQGTLEGKVWTRRFAPASNIPVMAYMLDPSSGARPDSLPAAPDYMTQTDATGSFRLESLAPGNYRLVALRDNNGNLRFDRGKDEFGVTSTPIVSTGAKEISLRLATGDASPLAIRSVRPVNAREIEVILNRGIRSRSLDLSAISIREKATGAPLKVLGYFTQSRADEESTFRLFTDVMNPKSTYDILLATEGSSPENAKSLEFSGGMHTVTYPNLSVAIVPADKSTNALLDMVRPDAGPCIELQFNLPVDESTLGKAVTVAAIRNSGEQEIPVSISRYDSRTWSLKAQAGFEPSTEYVVKVRPGIISTLAGARGKESLVMSRFNTAGPDQYGEISGSGSTGASEAIVEARREGGSVVHRTIVHPAAGGAFSFAFHGLPPGNYTVSAFSPASGQPVSPTTIWQSGSIEPFRPSDPFAAVTSSVRAGWTTETLLPRIPGEPKPVAVPATTPSRKKTKRTRH